MKTTLSAVFRLAGKSRPRLAPVLLTVAMGLGSVPFAQAQALHYKFNEKGNFSVNSGTAGPAGDLSLHTSDGDATDLHSKAGPSGKPCLDLNAATGMGTGFVGPCAKSAGGSAFDGALSFTISGWYLADEAPEKVARIFQAGPRFMLAFVGHGLSLQTGQGDYIDSVSSIHGLIEGGAGKNTSSPEPLSFNVTSQWVFFAVTYESTATETKVVFFRGDTAGTRPLRSYAVTYVPAARELGNSHTMFIGGSGVPNTRPFRGMLADFRVYASALNGSAALSIAEIEKIRASYASK